jgi:hypothetical protein
VGKANSQVAAPVLPGVPGVNRRGYFAVSSAQLQHTSKFICYYLLF